MPRVFITSCSVLGAWYSQDIGKSLKFESEDSTSYYTHLGRIPKSDAKLIYTEAEFNEILHQRNKAINDLAKHAQTIVDMQKEKLRLEDEVDQAMQRDRVELPRSVFNAIESFRDNGWSPEDIFLVSDRPEDGEWAATLHRWRRSSPTASRKLMLALANGYAIEQSPEERLHAKVEELIYNWLGSPVDEAGAEEIHRLAIQIVEHAKELT